MELVLHVPDEIACRLAEGGDLPRRALESIAIEGYRSGRLTLLDVSELLDLSRSQAETLLGDHQVALASYSEAELDREASVFANARRTGK